MNYIKCLSLFFFLLIQVTVLYAGGDVAISDTQPAASVPSSLGNSNKLLIGGGAALLTAGMVLAHKKWPWFNEKVSTPAIEHTQKWFENLKRRDSVTIFNTILAAGPVVAGSCVISAYFSHRSYEERLKISERYYRDILGINSDLGSSQRRDSWGDWIKNHKLQMGAGTVALTAGGMVMCHKYWPWFNKKVSTPLKELAEKWYSNVKKGDTYTFMCTSIAANTVIGLVGASEQLLFDKRMDEIYLLSRNVHSHLEAQLLVQQQMVQQLAQQQIVQGAVQQQQPAPVFLDRQIGLP